MLFLNIRLFNTMFAIPIKKIIKIKYDISRRCTDELKIIQKIMYVYEYRKKKFQKLKKYFSASKSIFLGKNIYICPLNISRHFSSAVEQLTRNEQVVGSNPMSGS